MSKLILFDGNAIMHRAYHALPGDMKARDGTPTNAVYGLVSMLIRAIEDLEPTHIAFAFDRPEPTFRKEILPDYQGHRPEMDDDLGVQFPLAQGVINAFGISVYDKAGYEADDIIGTIATSAVQKGEVDSVVIITGDRDILQLVNDKIKLYMPVKGLANAKIFGDRETVERMGVAPKLIIDLKALTGDPSDNYKGVPGIGPVTAIKLLKEYETLDSIYKNIDKITGKTQSLLKEHKDSAYQSQDLARIRDDVKIKFDVKQMKDWQIDSPKVLNKFEEIGFRTLKKRVQAFGSELIAKKQMSLI